MRTKLLKVIPITRGFSKELSYFSLKKVGKGDIVTIALRGKNTPALVVSEEKTSEAKTLLRRSAFPLKRVIDIKSPKFFTREFVSAARKTAFYFLADTGAVIKKMCPQTILEARFPNESRASNLPPKTTGSTIVLQASKKERLRFYKNLTRAEFAKNKSIFLCLPTVQEIKQYEEELKRGVEQFTFSFHGKMEKKEMKRKWVEAVTREHPVLIIATGLFLSLPRKDISAIVVENEGSALYKSKNRPFFDTRTAIQNLSLETGNTLILADEIIKTDTYSQIGSGKIKRAIPVSSRITSRARQILVDMKKNKSVVSDELREMLGSAYKKNEQTILFINRRGHGLSTTCDDCEKIIMCPHCDTPLVLHKKPDNKFLCHKCLFEAMAMDQCPYCGSWKLQTLGRGIQQVSEEVRRLFPDFRIFTIDSDTIKTKKQGEKIIKEYLDSSGSILLATQMLFSFPFGGADRIGVVSIDNLFNLPDFRINEKIFRLLLLLKTQARKTFLIQTRMPKNPIFSNVLGGDIAGFYQSELSFRKALGYPPFKTLIKISREGKNKAQIQKEIKALEKKLADYNPSSFAAFTPRIKNTYCFHILLKLDAATWPHGHEKLHQFLSSLPPQWRIDVDPESLL